MNTGVDANSFVEGAGPVIAEKAAQAVHILDRFHIMAKLNKAIDEARANEARQLKEEGSEPLLKHACWCLLKRPRKSQRQQMSRLAEASQITICSPTDFPDEAKLKSYFANVVTIPSGDNLRIQWLFMSAINKFPLLS